MDQTTLDQMQASYDELVRQSKIIKDNNDKNTIQGNTAVQAINDQVAAAQAKLDNIDQLFNDANAQRIKALDDRQDALEAGEAKNDALSRSLAAQDKDLQQRIIDANNDASILGKSNDDKIAKNQSTLDAIKTLQANLDDDRLNYAKDIATLAADQDTLKDGQADLKEKLDQAQALTNEAITAQADANNKLAEAKDTSADAQQQLNTLAIQRQALNDTMDANTKQQADIQAQLDALTAKKAEVDAALAEQAKNQTNIANISAKNQTDLIAIKAFQISVSQKERDLQAREDNIKILESQTQV